MVLGGAAIFVLGMGFLEQATEALSGRRFKLFLKRHTAVPVTAIGIGTLAAAALQSSSIINVLILSLAGSGAITLKSALGVTLGANLGATLNTWILSAIGFRFDISLVALPLIALSAIAREQFKDRHPVYNWCSAVLGIAFVMLGLEFIKSGMKGYVGALDLSLFKDYPVIIYFLVGAVMTALLQSSAATVAIVLGGLNSGALGLYAATAVVLGAEIGTTVKFLFVARGSDATVRRVAVGNFLYNLLNAVVMLLLLKPVNRFIFRSLAIENPLTALAFFQTLINLTAIAICAPLLNASSLWLTKVFAASPLITRYISKTPIHNAELSISAMEQETRRFLRCIVHFSVNTLKVETTMEPGDPVTGFMPRDAAGQYRFIKQLHGDIFKYYIRVQQAPTIAAETEDLDRLMYAVREGIFAAKCIHDAERDIIQLSNSANDAKYGLFLKSKERSGALLSRMGEVLAGGDSKGNPEIIYGIYRSFRSEQAGTFAYGKEQMAAISEVELTTLINFSRELFNGLESMILAMKDLMLEKEDRQQLEQLMDKEEEQGDKEKSTGP